MKSALIVVDMQYDFLPQGALGIAGADALVAPINRLIKLPFDVRVVTQDWHPKNHCSFASTWNKKPGECILLDTEIQRLWPDHCIQDSHGALLVTELDVAGVDFVVHKGTDPQLDSYSTFFDNRHQRSTGLESYLKQNKIQELYFAGLATDYCVLYSVLDAIDLGFTVFVVLEACQGIDLEAGDVKRALDTMRAKGVVFLSVEEVEKRLFSE